ncbi:MAG: tRNA pseudouridine(55) synthase TruB [Phycisphaeraceae bacterium]|nr:tRNA pseudouridine(55) synthase TruB [Phycisphaeraceae bacterium]
MTPSPLLSGLLVVDKPVGPTSFAVVRAVRRACLAAGQAKRFKVGHAGTLDPLASGVLICCLGTATRCVPTIMGMTKLYRAEVDLSAFSTTDDAQGPLTPVAITSPPPREAVERAVASWVGTVMQRPPAYSAIKVEGRRSYAMARKGQAVELPARPVRIDAIEWLGYDWPRLEIRITCGKGTYIRSLARDIGQALGVGGYLTALRREAVGPYDLAAAFPLDAIPSPLGSEHLLPPPAQGSPASGGSR